MSNKKIIKEEISETSVEKKQQLMKLTIAVEKAAFNLYEYAMTNDNIDPQLVGMTEKLKDYANDFSRRVKSKSDTEGEIEGNEEKINLEQRPDIDKRDFIESIEEDDENKEQLEENKLNNKISLKENKTWKLTIDVKKEVINLFESYSINGFNDQKTKVKILNFVEKLKGNIENLKENFGIEQTELFEEFVGDMETSENEEEFEEAYERITEWANKDNKLFIKLK